MKTKNLYIKQMVFATVVTALFCIACSDEWNDHYDRNDASMVNNGTLWSAITADGNLSNFARVVEGCDYSAILNGSQTFSVFAPTNDRLTSAQADSLIASYKAQKAIGVSSDDNTVVRQFLQNHISLYKHPVSSLTNDSIMLMNGKYAVLTPNAIDGMNFLTKNTLYNNGVLFTLGDQIKYFPNVFEYLGIDNELDSVYNFINSYSEYVFQPSMSVPGGIVDGRTVYLDSVTVLNNILFNALGEINSEDSTYWMVAPVNEEWNKLVSEYTDYFNYATNVAKYDSMQYANARLAIVRGTIFSRTENPDEAFNDSAVSTSALSYNTRRLLEEDPYYIYYKPFASGNIFDGTEDIICSNGHVRKAKKLNIDNHNTFLQTIKVEAESVLYQDTIQDAEEPLTVRRVTADNPFYDKISGNAFVDVTPKTSSTNPLVRFNIPDVLSNVGYDIYAVMAPYAAYDTLASHQQRLPNAFRPLFRVTDQNGKMGDKSINKTYNTAADENGETNVVDTVLIQSNYIFPTCSYGLSEPQLKLQIRSTVTSRQTSTYSRTLHIDCFLFVPHVEATEPDNAKRNNQ